jgi:hypothetical protein
MEDVYASEWALALIITFGCLCTFPIAKLLKIRLVDIDESEIHSEDYDDVYLDFNIDYERANPVTKKEGFKNYIKVLNEKKFISDVEYRILYDKIQNKKLVNILKYNKVHVKQPVGFLKHKQYILLI